MKHFFTLLCGVFIALTSFSQTAKLSGKIVDEKGEGLIQANVVIDASKGLATVTDFDGNYELALVADGVVGSGLQLLTPPAH